MIAGLLATSDSYWYVDVAIIVFLLLFLISGIIRGFAKSTKGFFAFVVIVCAAALLMGVTYDAAINGSLGSSIYEAIAASNSNLATDNVTSACVSAILFVIYVIAILLVFVVLRLVFRGLSSSSSPVLKAIDKILGALIRVFIGFIILWIILAIIAALGDLLGVVNEYIANSTIGGFFYENNPLTTVFTTIFG